MARFSQFSFALLPLDFFYLTKSATVSLVLRNHIATMQMEAMALLNLSSELLDRIFEYAICGDAASPELVVGLTCSESGLQHVVYYAYKSRAYQRRYFESTFPKL